MNRYTQRKPSAPLTLTKVIGKVWYYTKWTIVIGVAYLVTTQIILKWTVYIVQLISTNMIGMTVISLGDVTRGDRSTRINRCTQRSWSRPLPMNRLQLSRLRRTS